MGTRHLICAVIDGEYKIAQYGQWDGYPSGQGVGVLNFLKKADMPKFKDALRKCSWLQRGDIDRINSTPNWPQKFPHNSRDAGSDVLDMVYRSDGLKLMNSRKFAGDSLFCEFCYVIDFDNSTLEVFEGFNKEPTPENSRFASGQADLEKTDGYEPVRLVKTYSLRDLPTQEQFLADLEPTDDDEEAA